MRASGFVPWSTSVAALGSVLLLWVRIAQAAEGPSDPGTPAAVTRNAVFGIMVNDAAGEQQFVPTDSVPNVEGQLCGWFIYVGDSSQPVKFTETITLTQPASSPGPSGSPPSGVSALAAQPEVVQREYVPHDGEIGDFWAVARGDITGHYTVVVKLEGGREERFSYELVAPDSREGRTPGRDAGVIHMGQRLESNSGSTTAEAMQKRIEAAAHSPVTQLAPSLRVAWFDLTPPADAEEYQALAGFGVLLVTAITRDGSELPIQRVYLQSDQGAQDLRMLSSVGSTIKDSEIAKALGQHRYDAIYLFPMNLRHESGQLLVDFAMHRSNFVLVNLPLEPDAYPDSPPTAAVAPDDALDRLLRREFPGFVKSKESQ